MRRSVARTVAVAAAALLPLGAAAVSSTASAATGPVRPAPSPHLSVASAPTPYGPSCTRQVVPPGANPVLYLNGEVEPWVAVNPRDARNVVGVWQQDRWSDGGANALRTGYSFDGGRSWRRTAPTFSHCAGGNAANGGDYQRASDPWVSFGPTGIAHQISLSFDNYTSRQAILASRSLDGGRSWSRPATLTAVPLGVNTDFVDKESITADPRDPRLVYAVWDRLVLNAAGTATVTGNTEFTRSTNGGRSWEPVRILFNPGIGNQTIGNQIVVGPNGTLYNLAARLNNTDNPAPGDFSVIVSRSYDKGRSWTAPVTVSLLGTVGVVEPAGGEPVRSGDIIPDIAVAPDGTLYVVWQDARFSGGTVDQIVLSSSRDGGRTWTAPVLASNSGRAAAFVGSVDVTKDGAVVVTYYDFRQATPGVNALTRAWMDGFRRVGGTVTERPLGAAFDIRTAPFARGYFLGDYQGLTHVGPFALPFFVRARPSTANPTDVYSGHVGEIVPWLPFNLSAPKAGATAPTAPQRSVTTARDLGELVRSHRR
jgi:hypothetical protein